MSLWTLVAPLISLLVQAVTGGGGGPADSSESELSDEFKELVFDMMAYDYRIRPSLSEIRDHPWLKTKDAPQTIQDKKLLREQVIDEMSKLRTAFLEQ